MKKCLIMLTSSFPYGNRETFLENEIFFHKDSFEKIIILAQELSCGPVLMRKIPDNAEAFNIAQKNKKIARLGDTFRGALKFFTPSEACKTDKSRIGFSVVKKVFCEYFEERSHRQFKECTDILKDYDFSSYDEVVIYCYWFFAICRTGILLKEYLESKGIKTKIISRAHRYDLYEYANKLNYLPLRHLMAENVDKIYACSDDGYRYLQNQLPEFTDKIKCSYLGTTDHGTGLYDKTFHIVTCSGMIGVKRLDRLVDALESLKDSFGEIYWTHIGDGEQKEEIVSLCKNKLKFVDYEFVGAMSNPQVIEYYSSHPINLFINVSSSEGLPVSIMEAASFGIPVLATDVGGTGEIVIDGFNGYLLSKDFTNEEFAEKFSLVYNADKNEYSQLRANSRKYWEEHFNAADNFKKFSAIISENEVPEEENFSESAVVS